MSYTDKNLTCRDCGKGFVFTVGEQEFHEQKGFSNLPGRCPDCRAQNKAQGGFGGGSRMGGSRGMGGDREMHDVTCASCGKACQVPFKPSGDRPVYCSDCFKSQGSSRPANRSSRG